MTDPHHLFSDPEKERLRDILRNPAKYGIDICNVCGGKPDFVGTFWPEPKLAKRLGEPPGKWRAIFYGICEVCRKEPGVFQRIEDAIIQDMEVQ